MGSWFSAKESKTVEKTKPQAYQPLLEGVANVLITRLKIEKEALDVNKHFSDYGLDSLGAMRLVGDLEDWLNIELDATVVYNNNTVALLANHIAPLLDIEIDTIAEPA